MKKLQKIITITVFLIPLFLQAQWFKQTTTEWADTEYSHFERFKSVVFIDSLTGFLTGRNIYKTTDAGKNWSKIHGSIGHGGHGIFFMNSDTGWVTGEAGTYRTIDGGKNWEYGDTHWGDGGARAVHFINFERGIMVANPSIGGDIWNTYEGGVGSAVWRKRIVDFNIIGLEDVCFVNFTTGWAVGLVGQIIKTTDSGYTWFEQESGSDEWLFDVEFLDMNNGFAVGENGTILRTSNSGETWSKINSGVQNRLYQIKFVTSQLAFIVGDSGTILKSTDGGTTWLREPRLTNNHLLGLSFSSPNHGYAVGYDGELLRYIGNSKFLNLYTPNGGENYRKGDQIPIEWFSNSIDEIDIEFSNNNGSSWKALVTNYDASLGRYEWYVNEDISTECLIRVKDSDSNVYDDSDTLFTISQIALKLFEPIGNEELFVENYRVIRWTSENVDSINIDLSTDNGSTWSRITENISADLQSYIWEIPDLVSDNCKIRIADYNQAYIYSENYNPFTIIKKETPLYIWENNYQENENSYYAVNSIIQKSNGNYAQLYYWYDKTNYTNSGSFINEYSPNGSLIQKKELDNYYNKIIESSDGNYFVSGTIPGTNESEPTYQDISLAKLDYNCDTLWTTSFAFQGGDRPGSMTEVSDGIVICGYAETSLGEYARPVLIKTDKDGNELWKKTFSINGSYGAWSYSSKCLEKEDGNYLVLGFFGNQGVREGHTSHTIIGDIFISEFSSTGNHEWTKTYSLDAITGFQYWDERALDINITQNGYVIIGRAKPYEDYNLFDNSKLFLIEIDESGNEILKKWFNIGTEDLIVNNLIFDNNQNYLVSAYSTKSDYYYGSKSFVSHLVRINSTDGTISKIQSYNLEDKFPQLSVNTIFENGDYILSGDGDTLRISKYADESTTPVKETKSEIIKTYHLFQNYPNPFNPTTVIRYQIPNSKSQNVSLKVYDILGKEVATLVNKKQSAGSYKVEFIGNGLSSGVYFYRFRVYPANNGAGSFVETKKMLLLR